ncbi:FKBP-type peptidyl-prolyl cis-trans isomerase [Methanosarcina sp. UBA411]|uniref:FKBP-type peptidyl-prolyl cis-trans isomerase n=1 Tax=Methanosarcina sp. UBA411 TaxID=1915589 RepID=UPI0025E49450|nr:peptidylprolyl isomerase [Methanosarcina sp. UBA411]
MTKDTSKRIENGDIISVDYIGKLEDGTLFDTSVKEAAIEAGIYNQRRDYKPLTFTVGAGQMIKGFDEGVVGMRVGEEKTLTIPPEEAYGEYREELTREIPVNAVDFTPEVGMKLITDSGLTGTITEVSENNFVVNFNHELAGKTLIFLVRIVSVEE